MNTRDGITITARGLITYQIHDPRAAFMAVEDIHGAVKRGAEATLTSLFLNASIDEIAPSLPSHPRDELNPRNNNTMSIRTRPLVGATTSATAAAAGATNGNNNTEVISAPATRAHLEVEGFGAERADFSRHVRDCFLHDFSRQIHEWGIELKNVSAYVTALARSSHAF